MIPCQPLNFLRYYNICMEILIKHHIIVLLPYSVLNTIPPSALTHAIADVNLYSEDTIEKVR